MTVTQAPYGHAPPLRLWSSQKSAQGKRNFLGSTWFLIIRSSSHSILLYFKLLPLAVLVPFSPATEAEALHSNRGSCLHCVLLVHKYSNCPLTACLGVNTPLAHLERIVGKSVKNCRIEQLARKRSILGLTPWSMAISIYMSLFSWNVIYAFMKTMNIMACIRITYV